MSAKNLEEITISEHLIMRATLKVTTSESLLCFKDFPFKIKVGFYLKERIKETLAFGLVMNFFT